MMALERRLRERLGDGPLANRLPAALAPFAESRVADADVEAVAAPALTGLARAITSGPETARFLSHRPAFFARLASLDATSLDARTRDLAADGDEILALDLEDALDALRLRRREEMAFAACADLGGLAPFDEVARFLSILAETTTQIALALARRSASGEDEAFSVIGMGKIAGREFTYHSDLDLIFLYGGGPERVDRASRIGQRLIAYLTTMTGAGSAYAVDTRLRPSGQQGMLVTSYRAFERYQLVEAQTWEHLAVLRARVIAGEMEEATAVLDHVHAQVSEGDEPPWKYLADLRGRVERERAQESEGSVPFKTGSGGLMDVDFLAGGGLLERGAGGFPDLPSVAAMLRGAVSGSRVEQLLEDYGLLRIVEARARWIAGRGIESLETSGETLACVAELVDPGLDGAALLARLATVRDRIRGAWNAVVEAGTIGALGD